MQQVDLAFDLFLQLSNGNLRSRCNVDDKEIRSFRQIKGEGAGVRGDLALSNQRTLQPAALPQSQQGRCNAR